MHRLLIIVLSQLFTNYVITAKIENSCSCVVESLCKAPFYQSYADSNCSIPGDVCCARQSLESLPLSCGKLSKENTSDIAWVAGVLRAGNYLGTAVFIHPGIVVTVAHIVHRVRPSEIKIQVQGNDHRVTKILIHPQFRISLLHNDIALLVLENHLQVGVACFPELDDKIEGVTCKFAAARRFGGLKVKRMVVMQRRACEISLQLRSGMGPFYHLHNSFLCALGEVPYHKTSQGDGGGALLCPVRDEEDHWVHVGVASWRRTLPNVFSSMAKNIAWLDTMLANFNPMLDKFKF